METQEVKALLYAKIERHEDAVRRYKFMIAELDELEPDGKVQRMATLFSQDKTDFKDTEPIYTKQKLPVKNKLVKPKKRKAEYEKLPAGFYEEPLTTFFEHSNGTSYTIKEVRKWLLDNGTNVKLHPLGCQLDRWVKAGKCERPQKGKYRKLSRINERL